MIGAHWDKLPSELALGVVGVLILGSVLLSIFIKEEPDSEERTPEQVADMERRAHAGETDGA